jgi:hypothetical protein
MKRFLMSMTVVGVLGASFSALADCTPTCDTDCTNRRDTCIASCQQMYPDPNQQPAAEGQLSPRDRCEAACSDAETACADYCRESCAPAPASNP